MNKWKKTAKIQKKWDIPKGQPHAVFFKFFYHFITTFFPFTI